jgi:hypothetical protein
MVQQLQHAYRPDTADFLFRAVIHLLRVLDTAQRIFQRNSAPTDHHIAFSDALATTYDVT